MTPKWTRPGGRRTASRHDLATAISHHRAGRLDEARRLYRRVLASDPNDATALHFLGVLHHQSGDTDTGIASIERALRCDPGYADAHNNLGNLLKASNRLEPALRAYRRTIELVPDHADAWNNVGVLLRGQGRYEESDQAYARAIAINPEHAAAWQNRGNLLARTKRLDEAAAAYVRVLELRPGDPAAYDALGRTLYRAGRVDDAIRLYRDWLATDPGNSVAEHMLAACTGDAAPERASDRYVRDTFDAFAGSFDQVLDQLGYRAPQLVGEWLARELPAPDGSLLVADAGCGTGLCAEFLRPRAKRLVGVDLSPGMLARARAKELYDELVAAELTAWLAGQPGAFDVIVSADTLCYFGALDGVFAAAARALTPGGRLVFTLERAVDEAAYRLNPTGRYSHAERYVRAALAAAGLAVVGLEPVVLRQERGDDVGGLLVGAQRPRDAGPVL